MRWPWQKLPAQEATEEVVIEWGGDLTQKRTVYRDADDRPYVYVLGQYIWIDDEGIKQHRRQVMWLKRRPAHSEREQP